MCCFQASFYRTNRYQFGQCSWQEEDKQQKGRNPNQCSLFLFSFFELYPIVLYTLGSSSSNYFWRCLGAEDHNLGGPCLRQVPVLFKSSSSSSCLLVRLYYLAAAVTSVWRGKLFQLRVLWAVILNNTGNMHKEKTGSRQMSFLNPFSCR